jgi:hypothetical protein
VITPLSADRLRVKRPEVEELDARLIVVERISTQTADDLSRLRDKFDERNEVLAEHTASLRYITETLSDMKEGITEVRTSVTALTATSALLRSKVTWIIATLTFLASTLGGTVGNFLKQQMGTLPSDRPAISEPAGRTDANTANASK